MRTRPIALSTMFVCLVERFWNHVLVDSCTGEKIISRRHYTYDRKVYIIFIGMMNSVSKNYKPEVCLQICDLYHIIYIKLNFFKFIIIIIT